MKEHCEFIFQSLVLRNLNLLYKRCSYPIRVSIQCIFVKEYI